MTDRMKIQADRTMMHALLCVIALGDHVVFRGSMPTLGSLFRDGEEQLDINVAVERALEIVEARA